MRYDHTPPEQYVLEELLRFTTKKAIAFSWILCRSWISCKSRVEVLAGAESGYGAEVGRDHV